jgi:hypothetical protein
VNERAKQAADRLREQVDDGHSLIWCTDEDARALLAELEQVVERITVHGWWDADGQHVEEVIEEWAVTDRWWSDEPTVRYWREVRRGDKTVVQRREGADGEWQDVEEQSRS